MANPEHLSLLKESSKVWNAWREAHPTVIPNLRDADLSEMSFSYIDLHDADLQGVDLTCTQFFFANLQGANLSSIQASNVAFSNSVLHHTNLRFAQLPLSFFSGLQAHQADFTHAVLVNANCNSEADLSGSIFVETDARGANLTNTRLDGADLTDAKMDEVADLVRKASTTLSDFTVIWGLRHKGV